VDDSPVRSSGIVSRFTVAGRAGQPEWHRLTMEVVRTLCNLQGRAEPSTPQL
jgi:hypothetical protein